VLKFLANLGAVPIAMITAGLVDFPATAAETVAVKLHHHRFLPGAITVHPGDQVIFRNEDPDVHSVVLIDYEDALRETFVEPGQTFVFTVPESAKPGEYVLGCTIHVDMKARFVVRRS
jgi:plastocyanin